MELSKKKLKEIEVNDYEKVDNDALKKSIKEKLKSKKVEK